MEFGEKLFKLRKEKGLSQEVLAEKLKQQGKQLVNGKTVKDFLKLKS